MMTDLRFEYEKKLLEDCACSHLAAFITTGENRGIIKDFNISQNMEQTILSDESCRNLFAQHAQHFGRSHSPDDARYSMQRADLNGTINYEYTVGQRLENFVRNVVFIHQHNLRVRGGLVDHEVSLNRFADMDLETVLRPADEIPPEEHPLLQFLQRQHDNGRSLRSRPGIMHVKIKSSPIGMDSNDFTVIPLLSSENILRAADFTTEDGVSSIETTYKHNNKRKYDGDVPGTYVDVPMDQQRQFQAPWPDGAESDGTVVTIRRNPAFRRHSQYKFDDNTDPPNTQFFFIDANPDDSFQTYLNWATAENPDGVPIVNNAFDQGTCGSCWAFAAAGSVEASAARRTAYMSYASYVRDRQGPDQTMNAALRNEAIKYAQDAEMKAFGMLNLSIQELVDCDTAADQGCTGGNPLLAFYFIHKYGLTNADRYPYLGTEDQCRKRIVQQPVASVRSWGVVSPDHEKHMELALRFVGPIAVGFNGAEPSFLTYSGGIFDASNCKQGANHALLVVGYGEEEGARGETTKYWIVRNSWGRGWGENGFARIARRGGAQGMPGVCGIARSPSVALGGFMFEQQGLNASATVDKEIPQVAQGFIGLFFCLGVFAILFWGWRRRRKIRRKRSRRPRDYEWRSGSERHRENGWNTEKPVEYDPQPERAEQRENGWQSEKVVEREPLLDREIYQGNGYLTVKPVERELSPERERRRSLRDSDKKRRPSQVQPWDYGQDRGQEGHENGWYGEKPVERDLSPERGRRRGSLRDSDKKRRPSQVQPWDYDQQREQDGHENGWYSEKPVERDLSPGRERRRSSSRDSDRKRRPSQVQPWDYDQHHDQDRHENGWYSEKPVVRDLSPGRERRRSSLWDSDKKRRPSQVQPWSYDREQDRKKAFDQHSDDGQHSDNVWKSENERYSEKGWYSDDGGHRIHEKHREHERRREKEPRRGSQSFQVTRRRSSRRSSTKSDGESTPLLPSPAANGEWYGSLSPRRRGLAARTENLLSQLFPRHIAEALRDGKKVEPEFHECVTVYFSDIVGYTTISSKLPPAKVSDLLDRLYTKFDALCGKHNAFKVETVGDAYMVVTNIHSDQPNHVQIMAHFALDAVAAAAGTLVDVEDPSQGYLQIRVGFHSGPVVSNVVGNRNPRYSIIGDTVNTASRMESNSLPGFIQCSEVSAKMLQAICSDIDVVCRGEVKIKGKGNMVTYWVRPMTEQGLPSFFKDPIAEGHATAAASPKRTYRDLLVESSLSADTDSLSSQPRVEPVKSRAKNTKLRAASHSYLTDESPS